MAGTLTLSTLQLRTGTTVELPPTGVLCIVGGNNVGKSRLLADIGMHLTSRDARSTLVLENLEYAFDEVPSDVEEWLRRHAVVHGQPGEVRQYSPPGGGSLHDAANYEMFFRNLKDFSYLLSPMMFRAIDASDRAQIATSSMPVGQNVAHPLIELFRDGDLEERLSDICQRTFGFPLTLDRVNGEVLLRVGTPSVPSPPLQHPTREYSDSVLDLPALRDQGDGVKNYLGMVLHMMTGTESITVLDEPEAFLHPAQARALGRHLGEEVVARERQLLTATHDRDFVLGLLQTDCPVMFLRLNRTGGLSSATTLAPENVKAIWDRPVLRYSNILQGLFHRVVVVCEGDADCRWYSAVLDVMGRSAVVPSEEVLFVPAGGKGQVRSSLEALGSLDVTSFAILDFDGILDPDYVVSLLRSLGGDHEEGGRLARAISSQLTSSEQRRWAKESGLAGLPPGTVTEMAHRLIDVMRASGVLIVPIGELESFDRTIGGHGPTWVTAALSAEKHQESAASSDLLRPVLSCLEV
ncbi:AAA family ATPase [Georgenia sp. EYE_87]|uniref:AAA family ATPase n=1 Tax=Georgenia sp. EYE_87 TaxID=2853448 RepID=UPI002006AAC0|nr:AAA family ATPase [Georgenia sp. EYE_87]MCK6210533.1 AAA family ATPase [Georgenia sp. EYE_87]